LVLLLAGLPHHLSGVREPRYFNSRLNSLDYPLLEGQTILLVMLVQVNANLRQRFFGVFKTEARFDGIVAVAFLAVPLNAVFHRILIHLNRYISEIYHL
jgi:hypothetical protein